MMFFLCILTCLAGGLSIHLAVKALKKKQYFLFGFDVMMTITDVFLVGAFVILEFIL